jgi:aminoglycoside phosphotransferase (APT) family kinase protein
MITSADAELILRDEALPGLSVLLDPEALRTYLIRFQPKINWDNIEPYYIRYKRGMNCLVGYKVLSNNNYIFIYAKTFGPDAKIKIRKNQKRVQNPTEGKQTIFIVENPAITIHFFPNDIKLSYLNRLADPEASKNMLENMLTSQPELHNGTIESLRYKPERRYVAQLKGTSEEKAALKFYTPQSFQEAKAGAEAFSSQKVLKIPKRLGYSKSKFVQIFDWIPGMPLNDFIYSPLKNTQPFKKVGVALAELHLQDAGSLPYLSREKEAEKLIQSVEALEDISPDMGKPISTLSKHIVNKLLQEPPVRRPFHGDFYADQVILDDDSVGILDFDRAGCGDCACDLGLFLAHLERDVIYKRVSKSWAKKYCSALIAGYQSQTELSPFSRIELYMIMGLIHLSPEPFRHREPNWPDKIKTLLDRVITLADRSKYLVFEDKKTNCSGFKLRNSVHVDDQFNISKDPELVFATEALNPEIVKAVFNKKFSGWLKKNENYFLHDIRVVRHKPSRRCLIEYDFVKDTLGSPPEKITLLGKIRAKGLDENTFNLNKILWRGGFGSESNDGLMIPEPIECVKDWHMWLYKKVPGVAATDLIFGGDGIHLGERISAAIHKLHNCNIPSRRTHSISDEISILRQCLSKVIATKPDMAERIIRIQGACERFGESISPHPTTGIHRDFYPDQVIIDGEKSYIIDLDLYCNGDPSLDIGNFIGHLTEQSLRVLGDPKGLADCEYALEEKFLQYSGSKYRSNIQVYKNLTLARHIFISSTFPDRQEFTESLLELCEERLEVCSTTR